MINDVHCHFFSTGFFGALATQRGGGDTPASLCTELGWDDPGTPEALADRWIEELDRHEVGRAALIASVPGDEGSVAAAVARHPARLVGFFINDPSADGAADRVDGTLSLPGMRAICLFPAMHGYTLQSDAVRAVVDVVASHRGAAVFVQCGALSVGVRNKLGLPTPFNPQLGDPAALTGLAGTYPSVPFIVPHFGAGRLREALTLSETCPNVYLDTSSSNGWIAETPDLTLESVFLSALAAAGASRLLFGTDSSFFPRGWQRPIYERQMEALASIGATPDDVARIRGGNFDRLFPVAGGV